MPGFLLLFSYLPTFFIYNTIMNQKRTLLLLTALFASGQLPEPVLATEAPENRFVVKEIQTPAALLGWTTAPMATAW